MTILGTVLAEGRQHYSILERQASNFQGREELWDGRAGGLRVRGCSAGRLLGWGEVGDLRVLLGFVQYT